MPFGQLLLSVPDQVGADAATVPAQSTPELVSDPGLAVLAVLAAIAYVVYVAFTIAVGLGVLLASEVVGSGSSVRRIDARIRNRPVWSGVLGAGALVGGIAGFGLLTIGLVLVVELGAPEPLALLAAIPFFGGLLFLYVASTVGTIVIGTVLLRRSGNGSSPWLGLVVGALVVNIPGPNLVLGPLAILLGTGAMAGQWWDDRSGSPSAE